MSNDANLGLKAVVLVLDKFGAGREMEHIYVYNFGVGKKMWWYMCNRGNS